MRKVILAAVMAVAGAGAMAPLPAEAFKRDPFVAPEGGLDHAKGQRVWNDGKRGACEGKSSMCGDPYAYRYIQRAWYPNHNSRYWVDPSEMRYRYRYTYAGTKFRYYPAWGRGNDAHHDAHDHYGKPMK